MEHRNRIAPHSGGRRIGARRPPASQAKQAIVGTIHRRPAGDVAPAAVEDNQETYLQGSAMSEDPRIESLVLELNACEEMGVEEGHIYADSLLLGYIGNTEVTDAFVKLKKWYS